MNSHLFVLFSQYFVTGKAKDTIINVTRMVTPISEEIAPLLIKTSSNRSNLTHSLFKINLNHRWRSRLTSITLKKYVESSETCANLSLCNKKGIEPLTWPSHRS